MVILFPFSTSVHELQLERKFISMKSLLLSAVSVALVAATLIIYLQKRMKNQGKLDDHKTDSTDVGIRKGQHAMG